MEENDPYLAQEGQGTVIKDETHVKIQDSLNDTQEERIRLEIETGSEQLRLYSSESAISTVNVSLVDELPSKEIEAMEGNLRLEGEGHGFCSENQSEHIKGIDGGFLVSVDVGANAEVDFLKDGKLPSGDMFSNNQEETVETVVSQADFNSTTGLVSDENMNRQFKALGVSVSVPFFPSEPLESAETGLYQSVKNHKIGTHVIGGDNVMEDQVTEVGIVLIDETHNIASQLTEIGGYFLKEEQNKGGQVTEGADSAPVEKPDIETVVVDLKQDLGDKVSKLGCTLLAESQIASSEVTAVHVSILDDKYDTGNQGADTGIALADEWQSTEAQVVYAGRAVIDEKHDGGDRCTTMGIQDQNQNIGIQCTEDEASLPDENPTSTDAKEEENVEKEEEEEEEKEGKNQENQFSVGDFVWGKIRSHPWWPGQIYDPLNASKFATKRRKKDRLLVAYFGDGTFAWCNKSQLRSFQPHFEEMSKQSNSKNFQNAVEEALEEIRRLLELEITCSCLPDGIRCKLAQPVAVNAGIREEVTVPKGNIGPLLFTAFKSAVFLECLKDIAKFMFVGSGLELTVFKVWVSAIFRARGYGQLPVFHEYQENAENMRSTMTHLDGQTMDLTQSPVDDERLSSLVNPGVGKAGSGSSPNHPQSLEKSLHQSKKRRSVAELMTEKNTSDVENEDDEQKVLSKWHFPSKKPKKSKHLGSPLSSQRRNNGLALSEDTEKVAAPKYPKVSRVGESISRIASLLTGAPPIVKCSGETFQKKVSKVDHFRHKTCGSLSPRAPKENQIPLGLVEKDASLIEMLPVLRLAAVEPLYARECHISMDFFAKFRSSLYKKGADFGTYMECIAKGLDETGTIAYSYSEGDIESKKRKLKDGASSESPKKNSRGVSAKYFPETDTITHSCSQGNTERKKRKIKDGTRSQTPKKKLTAVPVKDSYEADLITCSSSEGNIERTKRKRKAGAWSQSPKKKSRWSTLEQADVEPRGANHGQSNNENLAALLLTFAPGFTLPSKADVITIFGKFGPLKESETEVLEDSGCAQVVFLRSCDAEAAFNSSEKDGAFGPAVVSSRLRYLSATSKALDGTASSSQPPARDPLLFVQHNLELMTSMLAKSLEQEAGTADKSLLESRAMILDEMKGLLKKLSTLVESST